MPFCVVVWESAYMEDGYKTILGPFFDANQANNVAARYAHAEAAYLQDPGDRISASEIRWLNREIRGY